jgi:hypothetical protein
MTQSLTDWLQHSRFVVVGIDKDRGHLRVKGVADACTDLTCSESTLVVGDDGAAGLDSLNPGDIVRVEGEPGRAERIVVVRRVWEELTSPEF